MLGDGQDLAVLSQRDGTDDEGSRRAMEGDSEEEGLAGGRLAAASLCFTQKKRHGGLHLRAVGGQATAKLECAIPGS